MEYVISRGPSSELKAV